MIIDNSFKMKRFILIFLSFQILQSLCSFRMTGAALAAQSTSSVILSEAKDLPAGIFVEAESFATKGGWQVDQQFMDLMGSPYPGSWSVPCLGSFVQLDLPLD